MSTFIPGYQTTVTLNAEDFSAVGSVVRLQRTRNVMTKPVFGATYSSALGGQRVASFSANGHLSAEKATALDALYSSDAPIAFSIQVGTAAGATDAGVHTGSCIISDLTLEANADGEWDWSITAQSSGTVTYTPAI